MKNSLNRRLTPFDITAAQWAIMETCYNGEANSISTLCRCIPVDAAAISRQVDRLVAKGFVQRRRSTRDRRNVRITLTADGRELVPRLAHIVYANNDHFASRLDGAEQAEFVRMLKKILAHEPIGEDPI
jgi:DNA-binding MarR family transcriptional regulator